MGSLLHNPFKNLYFEAQAFYFEYFSLWKSFILHKKTNFLAT